MIHELIDPKKKTIRNSTTRNLKSLNDNTTFPYNSTFEQSDCENKEAESSSTIFIPPWLRNSLGLNQRSNQNLDWSVCLPNFTALGRASSDQKTSRVTPRYRENNQNEFDTLRTSIDHGCCSTDLCESVSKTAPTEAIIGPHSDGKISGQSKPLSILWSSKPKESETDSKYTNLEVKTAREEDIKMTNADLSGLDMQKHKDEERRRLRYNKQRNRLRRRLAGDSRGYLIKNDVDFLLEMKAREVLENYSKKDVHSVSSDMKQLEAKLILLNSKCNDLAPSKLSAQELKLLQEIKNQASNKEDFDRLMNHVKEVNLREIIKSSPHLPAIIGEKIGNFEDEHGKLARENLQISNHNAEVKTPAEKDSLMSTDDENDIKRFSEFLSKNKNQDEKRKCLEEVRNYFERKRRSRLSKRRYLDDAKSGRLQTGAIKEDQPKEKQRHKEIFTFTTGKEKKKTGFRDEEIMEKAVNETLRKFMDLYHFYVSPTAMNTMKKKIIQAIQSDSFDGKQPGHQQHLLLEPNEEAEDNKTCRDNAKGEEDEKDFDRKETICSYSYDLERSPSGDTLSYVGKETKKRMFKTLSDSYDLKLYTTAEDNENINQLKKEFENFLNTIQTHSDIRSLKLQSIILEKEESSSKGVQFVYNFSKKVLDSNKGENSNPAQGAKNMKESATQTPLRVEAKRNIKSQTSGTATTCEQNLQTEGKTCISNYSQTESNMSVTELRDLKELKGFNITPGLYRMVKSREPGRFYLYPEKPESLKALCGNTENKNSSLLKVCETGKTDRKKEPKRMLVKVRSVKFRRVPFRDKERGKIKLMKSKKGHYVSLSSIPKPISPKPEMGDNEKIISPENYLNFKNVEGGPNDLRECPKREGEMLIQEAAVTSMPEEPRPDLPVCSWLWNGEKITPGCDLKTHVEDLLKEKLKEITKSETQNKLKINESFHSNAENGQVVRSKSSEKNLETKNINALFCFRSVDTTQEETLPLLITPEPNVFANRSRTTGEEITENGETLVSTPLEKMVKDVATQNSQQSFSSITQRRLRSRSKTSTCAVTSNKKPLRKKNLVMTSVQDTQDNMAKYKKVGEIIKAVREIKKMRREVENCDENSAESASTEESSSYSTSEKTEGKDMIPLLMELMRDNEGRVETKKESSNKIRNVISLVDHEVQTNTVSENSIAHRTAGSENFRHCELIESLLNKGSPKERERLWNDVRNFIKTKIGKDINDDSTREICIEIEHRLPKTSQGKMNQTVMAKGHYVRNEGDVEVEIDLTLDDLERILRHRRRKMWRQQMCHRRTRRLISSSSVQSDLIKDELSKYEKYFQRFKALGKSLVKEKDLNPFKKSRGD